MTQMICCICNRSTDDAPDYVQFVLYAPDHVKLTDDAGIREQYLGAHGTCLHDAMGTPGAWYVDVPLYDKVDVRARDADGRDILVRVRAQVIAEGTWQILDASPEDEWWEFDHGSEVTLETRGGNPIAVKARS